MSKSSLNLFLSYAHTDEAFRKNLLSHLSPLKHQGIIVEWTDRELVPGCNWNTAIHDKLQQADLILLLISSDFLSSEYCYGIELKHAMTRHNDKSACVVPVILRPCSWGNLPFSSLQALPEGGKAISTWEDRDLAFLSVVQGIENSARAVMSNSNELVSEWLTSLLFRRKVVREVQLFLRRRSVYYGPVDGEPANIELRNAVKQFQLEAGIYPDGLIGPQTLRAMLQSMDIERNNGGHSTEQ